jgi:TolB-like protein
MAPEQAMGQAVDARCDLFAAGAILFEMLAGRPAFSGQTVVDVLHAALHEQPPALTGSPAVAAVDRVIRRALAKRPADRFASADEIAEELRALQGEDGNDTRALARALTRIVVLPFRVLRPDPETDFLAFSLPDAITTSLSGVGSLVVRSSATAARFASETPDLRVLAAEADVDRVVMGTLLRAGDHVRATAQLVDAPGGTVLTSHTIQAPLGDLFALQDDIARRVVAALSLPLAGGVMSPTPDAPQNPRAYEFYLRANELARAYGSLAQARDLYVRALELDPRFAPAWAHLGRCHRVIGKYIDGTPGSEARAQEAFERALALDPRLSVAPKFFANLEADIGQAQRALVRLLQQAARHGNDPELFAGLVHTCRYCGLYEEAITAHAEARRLDPNVSTSLEQTLLMAGDLDGLLAGDRPTVHGGGDEGIRIMGLGLGGRREEARQALLAMRHAMRLPAFQAWTEYLMAWLDRRPVDMRLHISALSALRIQEDPEAIFLQGWLLCDAGAHEAGLAHLQHAVAKGYCAAPTLAHSRQFDALRADPAFRAVQANADDGRQRALAAFRDAGGERLLGRHPLSGAA